MTRTRFGGHDDLIEHKDFETIAYEKLLSDNDATANANKIIFFDTDI